MNQSLIQLVKHHNIFKQTNFIVQLLDYTFSGLSVWLAHNRCLWIEDIYIRRCHMHGSGCWLERVCLRCMFFGPSKEFLSLDDNFDAIIDVGGMVWLESFVMSKQNVQGFVFVSFWFLWLLFGSWQQEESWSKTQRQDGLFERWCSWFLHCNVRTFDGVVVCLAILMSTWSRAPNL